MNVDKKTAQNQKKIVIPKNIGINISVAMQIANITQTELAQLLGITQAEISLWKNSKRLPNILELKKMSEIFKKPMEWFFKEIE